MLSKELREAIKRKADFSPCGKFRYMLTRRWADGKPRAMCIGLNPSTANAEKDDPTIRLLIAHLNVMGYGSLLMCNLYALISSKPGKLWDVADNQGENDAWLWLASEHSDVTIFCWGNFKGIEYRAHDIAGRFPQGKCFGKTKSGAPIHPLALMYAGSRTWTYKLHDYCGPEMTLLNMPQHDGHPIPE